MSSDVVAACILSFEECQEAARLVAGEDRGRVPCPLLCCM